MAFTLPTQVNLYNPNFEGLTKTDLFRRGLASGGFQEDAANKAFGGPQYVYTGTTSAAETGTYAFNLVTQTRSVPNPLGSPSLNDPILLQGLALALTAGSSRLVRFRVTSTLVSSGAKNTWEASCVVQGAATPVVVPGTGAAAASVAPVGSKLQANDGVNLVAAAGSLVMTITSGTAAAVNWYIEVRTDDPV